MTLPSVLVVGHYSHDTLIHADGTRSETLGGSAAYISSAFSGLKVPFTVVSKVGSDFAYTSKVKKEPQVVRGFQTSRFIADFTSGQRIGRVGHVCEPIFARDIPQTRFSLGLAVGVVGEVLPETLHRIAEVSDQVLCDAQGLLRTIDSRGEVKLRSLRETPYFPMVSKISYLKASRNEAQYIDLQQIRQETCVLVTEGEEGCTVYQKDQEFHVPAFPVREIDPTGAGDCFLAGFAAGILQGQPVLEATRMGNYLGSLAVGQVGIPHIQDICVPPTRPR